jgi:hypothetical protein
MTQSGHSKLVIGWNCAAAISLIDRHDARHIGRVEVIRHGAFVTVRWQDSGWTSEVPIERLERS